jgi:hypothetical protein
MSIADIRRARGCDSPRCCPAPFALLRTRQLTATAPVGISPKSCPSAFRQVAEADRIHPGTGTGLISECRPRRLRNRDRLAPESAPPVLPLDCAQGFRQGSDWHPGFSTSDLLVLCTPGVRVHCHRQQRRHPGKKSEDKSRIRLRVLLPLLAYLPLALSYHRPSALPKLTSQFSGWSTTLNFQTEPLPGIPIS